MPTPTDVNTEDIAELKQSNKEVLAAVHRVADSVHALEVSMTQRFGHMESEMTQRFGHMESETTQRFGRMESETTQRFGRMESEMERRFGQVEKQMAEDHAEAMKQIAVLGAEIRNVKGIGKWILGAVLTLLAGVGGAIWWASQIDYRVGRLEQPTKVEATKH